jgi:hypothetical protein
MTLDTSALRSPVESPIVNLVPDDSFGQIDKWLRSPPSLVELWQYALEYRSFGLNVFPLRGKKPVTAWKHFQTKRPSLDNLQRLIFERSATGLAAVVGWISGHKANGTLPATKLCVRDYDSRESFFQWAERYPQLAATLPLVSTKRGFHVYCWSTYEVFEEFNDGELRAKSTRYVLLPPSQHPDGPEIYRWVKPLPFRPSAMPILDPQEVGFYPEVPETSHTQEMKLKGVSRLSFVSNPQKYKRTSSVTHAIYRDIGVECCEVDGSLEKADKAFKKSDTGLSKPEWEAIWVSMPDEPGQREGKIFELARRLKGMPHLTDAPANSLVEVVRAWWTKALPVIRTKNWKETWQDFSRAWQRVRFPIGTGPIHEMIRATKSEAEPPEASSYRRPEVRRLIRVCRDLQIACEMRGSDWFYLSCRTASVECGFDGPNGYRTAARWLKRLVEDGILELVQPGIRGTTSHSASEYRFKGFSQKNGEALGRNSKRKAA